jgi:hypothetical protein
VCDDRRVQRSLAGSGSAAGAALVAAAMLAGCGTSAAAPASRGAEREWVANASGVLDQLSEDLDAASGGGATVSSARRALHDESTLYGLLLSYTDFGGCNTMVADVGRPAAQFRPVERTLRLACVRLQRAATLFTRAASHTDPHALLAASRQAARASPLLYRATLQLAAARKR